MGLNQPAERPPRTEPAADQCRCDCGSLLARIVEDGVEIRCRRCKRDLLVPWSARAGWAAATPVRRNAAKLRTVDRAEAGR